MRSFAALRWQQGLFALLLGAALACGGETNQATRAERERADAIIGGEPAGSRYSNVAFVWITWDDGSHDFCSGTLIAPDVVLTAAHCAGGIPGNTATGWEVTFDSELSLGPADIWWNAELLNPTITATPYVHEDFWKKDSPRGGTPEFFERLRHDIAVLVLDRSASEVFPGLTPASLPELGTLEAYESDKRQLFTLAGYGGVRPVHGPANVLIPPFARLFATAPFKELDPYYLFLEGNANNRSGTGGICSGDSGGPVFVGDTVVAVNSNSQNRCNNKSGHVRLDTESAREFLSEFVDVP